MKGLISSLVSLVDIAPGRVLASLGMGFVTFGAVTTTINSVASIVSSNWGGLGGAALQLASLAGFPTAFGMIIGAVITRVSINTLPKLGKIT